MSGLALAAPIIPGKLDEFKAFSQRLNQNQDYADFVRTCGLDRVRCWLQEGPEGATAILLYEGDDPTAFLETVSTSQDEFPTWFRQQVLEINGMDLTQPLPGPPPQVVTDVKA